MRWLGPVLLGLNACTADPPTPPALADLEEPGGERFELDPPVIAQGATIQLRLRSRRSSLRFDGTQLELLGTGLTLREFTVLDGYTAFAELDVAADAPTGIVPAELTIDGQIRALPEALTIIAEAFSIEPGNAKMGEVITVALSGRGTDWNSSTWASFGPDVQTIAVDVHAPTELTARIAIASDALPGFRDITVEEGERVLTLYDGFTVDRAVITASWDPPVVRQGDEVAFRIEGVNTRFEEGITPDQVQFWNRTAPVADLIFLEFVQQSPTLITGLAKVSNAATPGSRDVFIDASEDLLIADALEILPTPIDPLDARLAMNFDLTRTINRSSGETSESIRATATFVIPLDPPCQVGFNPAAGPIPFDINGVFPVPLPVLDPVDCPELITVDAGDFVWFEGPANTVTLDKDVNPNTGAIFYRGNGLTVTDYHHGQTYDLRVQGAVGGIPPFFVPDAQPTVPNDYVFTAPNFQNLVIDRFEDFEFTWTEAGVFPIGQFSVQLSGTLIETNEGGYAGVVPFDDGRHRFRPNQLSQLFAGSATFSARSRVEGRVFQLPFNNRNTQADSIQTTRVDVVLE